MAILEFYENQTLATVSMTVPSTVDLNDAASVKIKYTKPNGFQGTWNAEIVDADAGTIKHEVVSRYELDDTGWWSFWTFTTMNDGREMPGVPIPVYVYEQGKRYLAFPYGRQPVIGGEEMATNAFEIDYDNATSGLSADDVQEAIDELKNLLDAIEAGDVAYDNVASGLSSTNVQTVIDELLNLINAKTAEDFTYDPEHSGLYSTSIQTAIDEIVQEFNIDLANCTFVSKSGQDTESLMSWQEFGLNVASGDDSGLAATTTYYIKVNGTQYSITTATAPVSYADVVGLLDAALDTADFAVTFETNDIRVTNETVGVGEYVLLETATTGPNLETSLTGFTAFDIPYYAELGVTRGTLQNPYLTVQAAIDSVTPTYGTYEMIFVFPGIYEEDLILKPWISLVGLDKNSTIVGKSTTGTNHAIDYPVGTADMEVTIKNIGFYENGFAVTHAAGTNAAILRMHGVNCGDDFTVQFLGGGLDHIYMSDAIIVGLTTLDSAPIEYPNHVAFMGGLEIVDTSNANDDPDGRASSTIARNCAIFDHFKQEGDTLFEARATHIQVTGVVKVTLDGADVVFQYDAVSAPLAHSDFIELNGATRTPITRAKDIALDPTSITGTSSTNVQDALEDLHP